MISHGKPKSIELYALLAWHPPLGLPIYPVGVLAVQGDESYVAWTPMTYETGLPWRRRLANPPIKVQVAEWLEDTGTVQLAPLDPPATAQSLEDAAEAALFEVLAEILPALEPPGGA